MITKNTVVIADTNPNNNFGTISIIKRSKFPIITEKQNIANDTHMAYSVI